MLDLENKEILRLFPSLIFKGRIADQPMLDQVLAAVMKMKDRSQGSKTKYKFTTPDDLHQRPEFADLTDLILKESGAVLDFFSVQRDGHYITSMWSHVTESGHRHPVHNHPNNYLSGVIYLKAPENCGNTIFLDPRQGATMIKPDYEEPNYFNMSTFIHKPETGVMLIWNSWLPHMVDYDSVETDQERAVISFNIMLKCTVNRLSEKVVF